MTDPLGVPADADLAARAAAGDRAAYQELFRRHVEHVRAICRQRLQSAADVDDAVQETFARALAHLLQLRDAASFGPWIRSIAVRVCVDHHRASARSFATPLEEIDLTDSHPQPDELIVAAEHSEFVRQSFAELGARDARALWLRHVGDVPVAAVASELGLTPGSTRVLLTRARHRLRAATSALPALLPLSWRQWLRDHLPASGPVVDTLVAAVALGLVVVALGPAPSDSEAHNQRAHAAPTSVSAMRPERGVVQALQPQAVSGRRAGGGDENTASRHRSGATSSDKSPTRKLTVAGTVTVQDEYPDDNDAGGLADISVFSEDEETEARLYGGAPKPVKQLRRELPKAPDATVDVGGVRVGKDGDRSGS